MPHIFLVIWLHRNGTMAILLDILLENSHVSEQQIQCDGSPQRNSRQMVRNPANIGLARCDTTAEARERKQ